MVLNVLIDMKLNALDAGDLQLVETLATEILSFVKPC